MDEARVGRADGLIGAAQDLGGKLIGSLPAQFLVLCVVNLVFILGLLWFLNEREAQRERLLGPFMESCEKQIPLEALQQLLSHLRQNQRP